MLHKGSRLYGKSSFPSGILLTDNQFFYTSFNQSTISTYSYEYISYKVYYFYIFILQFQELFSFVFQQNPLQFQLLISI